MAEPNYKDQNTSYIALCTAFPRVKLNWRLTVHDSYYPFSYHRSVKRVHG